LEDLPKYFKGPDHLANMRTFVETDVQTELDGLDIDALFKQRGEALKFGMGLDLDPIAILGCTDGEIFFP